jgi:hypothetical protein
MNIIFEYNLFASLIISNSLHLKIALGFELPIFSLICEKYYFFKKIYFIHMCIQCLGYFFPQSLPSPFLSSAPSLTPLTPHYQAETTLPLSLILLKREYEQQ